MQKLSLAELNRISIDEFKNTQKTPLVIILDNIRSALNVGSAFRTCDAFLVQEIALCGITAQPPHREILKTAIGATKSVDWKYFSNTYEAVDHYKGKYFKIAAIEQAKDSTLLQELVVQENEKIAIVFGNEVNGVDQSVMNNVDVCIEIPQFGTKHSFNVSVSMGIVIWELVKKIRPKLFD
ncbi:MAG: RNA methyltransferase [Saprospiraceae bacterium]|nr:RNA methyltransferase [Saprospiraceae bacterium]